MGAQKRRGNFWQKKCGVHSYTPHGVILIHICNVGRIIVLLLQKHHTPDLKLSSNILLLYRTLVILTRRRGARRARGA